MLSSTLNTSLKRYVETLPSRNTMFVTGPYESGKSQTLNLLAEDLFTKQRLVLNLDASKFPTEVEFVSHLKTSLLDGLLKLRPYLSADILKSLNPKSMNKSISLPLGLDSQLGQTYLRISKSIDQILNKDNTISTYGIYNFFSVLHSFSDTIRPVIFLHSGDTLINTSLYHIVSSSLSRKNLYTNFVPTVIELRDSSILNNISHLSSLNTIRISCSQDFNETAFEILIRSKIFSAYELRRVSTRLGAHGGALAHVFEDLKFGINIDEAIEHEENRINEIVNNALTRAVKKSQFVQKLCKSSDGAFAADVADVMSLKKLFEKGLLYTDDKMRTKVANKGVMKALCT
ncbi:hypothetical protein GPJ56_004134 [Histomonas meleagridis]|uniref:uncharacterized protein n=1 Tax=Histomonas meleagridis TaxID=135588 RepID=UPI00355A6EAE|nr:hypothetical protein GPJ56_004134 [Histomonas meleagridis]KAH0801475.1 hypothetical protein GO595_005727 [Histomonas meleagridis]